MRKILFVAVIVGLLLTVLPAAGVSAAPSLGPFDRLRAAPRDSRSDGLEASPSAGWYSAPPAQGGGIPGKVVAYFVQLYKDVTFQVPAGKVWQGYSVEVSSPAGGVRYVRCPATGVEGWVGEAAIGTSITLLSGAFLPPELTYGAIGRMQSVSHCQIWLECNGYRTVGTGRIARLLDQSGILTVHPEDCVPYRRMPRPRGCYP